MSDLNRSAKRMAILTVFSRASGFIRIAVFASVFGKTFLSNTYQSSNMIPNLLFELFAAGALQAALVPAMVRLEPKRANKTSTDGKSTLQEEVAGAVLGLMTAVLAFVAVVAILAGPLLMGLLVSGVSSAEIREAEIRLGSLWLWFFMPQVVFYGANIVATSVLNAKGSFVIPVAAPIVNNVVVIGAYLWFGAIHEGPLTLDVTTGETWIIAGGTTLGVIAFCAVPIAALMRSGFSFKPNLNWRLPDVRRLLREGAWAAVFLGFTQILLFVVLRVSNRDPGGPVIFQFAFILFTLPHSLLSVPIMTTRFPAMSDAAHERDWASYMRTVSEGMRSIIFLGLGATAISVAVARPATSLVSFGEARGFSTEIANATIAFAPGIVGFGLMLYFTRALYARGDSRSPALVNGAVVIIAAVAMLTVVQTLSPDTLVSGLALTFGAAQIVGCALLYIVIRREPDTAAEPFGSAVPFARGLAAASVAGVVGFWASEQIGYDTRIESVVSLVFGLVCASGLFILIQWATGGPNPKAAASLEV